MMSPAEAFSVLGDETRLAILLELVDGDGPLSFSTLRDRVGIGDSGRFNYHLGRLEGHFVRKTDGGYELRRAGRNVIEAVLSGAVTDDPQIEPTRIDEPCPHCNARMFVAYRGEQVHGYCRECDGVYDHTSTSEAIVDADEYGYLGGLPLPPAGVQGRTPDEVNRTGYLWGLLEIIAVASGLCPSCSAPLDESIQVCEDHDTTDGVCGRCGNRYAVLVEARCRNCHHEQSGSLVLAALSNDALQAFLIDHGINPVTPASPTAYERVVMDYDEEIRSVDPLEARLTFAVDDDTLTLEFDHDLAVEAVTN